MAIRTSDAKVRATADLDSAMSLQEAISRANTLTDKVDARDTGSLLTDADLEQIETLLACHYAALKDPYPQSESTAGASATYQQRDFYMEAATLDETGFLASLRRGRTKASVTWLGKRPSAQTDYADRD